MTTFRNDVCIFVSGCELFAFLTDGMAGSVERRRETHEGTRSGIVLSAGPDVIFVVAGDINSGNRAGFPASNTVPIGGAGAQFSWTDQSISGATGRIASSGSAFGGTLRMSLSGRLAFAPQAGADSFATHVTIQAYVRGGEQCFSMQCASSGTISVSHPDSCRQRAGPFVRASWNGQAVGSLYACTPDVTLPLTSESCADSGTLCGAAVRLADVDGRPMVGAARAGGGSGVPLGTTRQRWGHA